MLRRIDGLVSSRNMAKVAETALTRIVSRIEPVPSHQTNCIRQNRPRHRIPTTYPRARSQRYTILRLQPRIQLQIINMAIQLPRRLRDLLVRAPVLEVRELLEPEERAELVHRAHAPLPALHDAHDLDDAQRVGDAPRAVRACHLLGRIVQDAREVVVAEAAIGPALEPSESARGWVRVNGCPGSADAFAKVAELELVERLVAERLLEDVLGPLDVLLCRRGMPLCPT